MEQCTILHDRMKNIFLSPSASSSRPLTCFSLKLEKNPSQFITRVYLPCMPAYRLCFRKRLIGRFQSRSQNENLGTDGKMSANINVEYFEPNCLHNFLNTFFKNDSVHCFFKNCLPFPKVFESSANEL